MHGRKRVGGDLPPVSCMYPGCSAAWIIAVHPSRPRVDGISCMHVDAGSLGGDDLKMDPLDSKDDGNDLQSAPKPNKETELQ